MKLVLIEWSDSSGDHDEWKRIDEIIEDGRPIAIRSVGWLVSTANKAHTVVPHISGENSGFVQRGSGGLTIPNHAIIKKKVLQR